MSAAQQELGRLDILVNNAGLQHVAPVVDFPEVRCGRDYGAAAGVVMAQTASCRAAARLVVCASKRRWRTVRLLLFLVA